MDEHPIREWDFTYYVGNKNANGKSLTQEMLDKWKKDPERKVECVFCGETYPDGVTGCRRCREYKGIQPYIEEWSDWG